MLFVRFSCPKNELVVLIQSCVEIPIADKLEAIGIVLINSSLDRSPRFSNAFHSALKNRVVR